MMAEGETTKKHREQAPEKLTASVLTVSDSKYDYLWRRRLYGGYRAEVEEEAQDVSGRILIDRLGQANIEVVFYSIVPDHRDLIKATVSFAVEHYSPDLIVATGGTGISRKDVTIEALKELYNKELEGFGEFFRSKSSAEIGSAALLSRASAGVYNDCLIFSIPGSPDACTLGAQIINSEAAHLVKHTRE